MRSTQLSRQIFASLSQNDLAEMLSQKQLGRTIKLEQQVEDVCTSRLRKEVEELSGKNFDCEIATRTIRITESEIVELEKRLSEESTHNRAARERLLLELASTRSKLASQKRRLAELEGQVSLLQISAAEIKARMEAKNAVAFQLQAKAENALSQSQQADTDCQNEAIERQKLSSTLNDTSKHLTHSNTCLHHILSTLEASKIFIRARLCDKKTLNECLQKLTTSNQAVRQQTKEINQEIECVENQISDLAENLAWTQREQQAKDIEYLKLGNEAQFVEKQLDKKNTLLRQAEIKANALVCTLGKTEVVVQNQEVRLASIHGGQDTKEGDMHEVQVSSRGLLERQAALQALGRAVLAEMQGMVRGDNSIQIVLDENEELIIG